MSAVNETLIRDVVAEVLGRIGGTTTTTNTKPAAPVAAPAADCGCHGKSHSAALRGKFGVFQNADEACDAAHEAFLQLSEKGVAGRNKVIKIIKDICDAKAEEWGKLELDETKIGRLDHKIEKLKGQRGIPGTEFLNPY